MHQQVYVRSRSPWLWLLVVLLGILIIGSVIFAIFGFVRHSRGRIDVRCNDNDVCTSDILLNDGTCDNRRLANGTGCGSACLASGTAGFCGTDGSCHPTAVTSCLGWCPSTNGGEAVCTDTATPGACLEAVGCPDFPLRPNAGTQLHSSTACIDHSCRYTIILTSTGIAQDVSAGFPLDDCVEALNSTHPLARDNCFRVVRVDYTLPPEGEDPTSVTVCTFYFACAPLGEQDQNGGIESASLRIKGVGNIKGIKALVDKTGGQVAIKPATPTLRRRMRPRLQR